MLHLCQHLTFLCVSSIFASIQLILPALFCTACDNTPAGRSHYLDLPNHPWPSDRLVVSLISGQGYFTFLYKHTKHNIHNRGGWKKRRTNNHRLGLAPSARRETLLCSFLCICGLSRACIRAKFPHSHQEC